MKRGDLEIEVQGTQKEVSDTFNHLDEYRERFLKTFSPSRGPEPTQESLQQNLDPESPDIPPLSGTESKSEAVMRLLSSGWGQSPRTMGEIIQAMRDAGLTVPSTSLSGVLVNLVKRGKVRRRGTARGFAYWIPFVSGTTDVRN
jgi:hypothetical protein